VKIDSRTFLAAYAHRAIFRSDIGDKWLALLRSEYMKGSNVSLNDLKALDKMLSTYKEDSGFDRTAIALQYERCSIFERSGDFKQAIESNPFSHEFPKGENLNSDDSLAISLLALHFAQLPGASPATPVGEEYYPASYQRATNEVATEIKAERNFLNGPSH
jgi:hypothetical protein